MIKIRPGKFRELETILDFQMKMAEETEGIKLDRDTLFSGIEAVFEDPGKGHYYMAVNENDEAIACLLTTPEWSEWRNGTVLWIQSVYVEKEYRGQGVFKQMYQYLQKMVNEDDEYMGLRLYVEVENVAAQKVYKGLGMKDDHYQFFEWMKNF
ncbi:GNAT family N-acetyltransferase [Fulvivirga sp. RKSG066]|uniref:GNAT family N-acetyltransferase n=1 Tax=Fulvivirga aurantia TaxID=2529383 RepID=UPI0012BBD8D3|nr:GNAT family N-acetyltransferase [Fulvivirga aurantia]MTI22491.1 GNAT family N-acetyltransferase [Fulvivirga aurantia]